MPDTEPTDVVEQLRALGGDFTTTNDSWRTILVHARARRRRRSAAVGMVAAAAVVAVVVGGLAVTRLGADRDGGRVPVANLTPSPSGVDPWTDPVLGPGGVPEPVKLSFDGGVRLALLRDDKGTYAITAGVVGASMCLRVGTAAPAGSAPIQTNSFCTDKSNRQLWVSTLRVAGQQGAFVIAAGDVTDVTWQRDGKRAPVALQDLPGSGRKVGLLVGPRLGGSAFVATAGGRPRATKRFGAVAPFPPSAPTPTTADAVTLFQYMYMGRFPMTLWAQHQADGTVRFVGTTEKAPGMAEVFQELPGRPDRAVQEAPLDRVALGERLVCGTARADVAIVVYRLADGRVAPAALRNVPRGGRVWCAQLPHERLDKPPADGDRIVATLDNGSTDEVVPQF